jgi:hypothetical protein
VLGGGGTTGEVLEKFASQFKKLEEAIKAVIEFLGMMPMDETSVVPFSKESKLTSVLIGSEQTQVLGRVS